MIPPWEAAIAQAADVLAPGGRLAIVDFGQQERLPAAWRRLLFAWLAQFHVSPRADLPAAARRVADARELHLTQAAIFGGYAQSIELGAIR
jgi:S-adenosylmethionine-diacylgycerolhomoserine-N-methlytransferase